MSSSPTWTPIVRCWSATPSGGAVAPAAAPSGVDGLALLDPAGLVRVRVGPPVLATTLPWVLRPTPVRRARLLRQLHAPSRRDCLSPVRSLQPAVRDLPDVDLRPIPAAGHLAPDEQPEVVVAALGRLAAGGAAAGRTV